MKKAKIIYILAAMMLMSWSAGAQITVTGATGQNVKNFLRAHFLGNGVELDTLHGHLARFNGQETIASNQIGSFVNANTGANHMPIDQGIVLAACNASGSGSASPASDGNSVSTDLYITYHNNGGTMSMNDVACLSFYVRPSGDKMSFKYSFASDEYPSYVCSQFNDVFGLFVTGPFDLETGNMVGGSGAYNHTNIATIPGTETAVMINTVNGGTAAGSTTPCILTNTQYFVSSSLAGCEFNGCTVELDTKELSVSPCYTYKLELAICNISDHALPSAVYLKANSFTSAAKSIWHQGTDQTKPDTYLKGCSADTVGVLLNYVPEDAEQYDFSVVASNGSTLTKGVDYEIYDMQGNVSGSQLNLSAGDTTASFVMRFMHNDAKPAGTVDTLYVVGEYVDWCLAQDTIMYILKEPDTLLVDAEGGRVFCNDVLPANDTLTLSIRNAIDPVTVRWEKEDGTLISQYELKHTPEEDDTTALDTTLVYTVYQLENIRLSLNDNCGRSYTQDFSYTVNSTQTTATISDTFICERERVELGCPESQAYQWTATPEDSTLTAEGGDTIQNPVVYPKESTEYVIQVTDMNGCRAWDTVSVVVVPDVTAMMQLDPQTTTLTNTNVRYADITVNSFASVWDFGDGNASTQVSGTNTYPSQDTGTYVVTLISYNEAGCADTITDTVRINYDFTFYMPNAFTPGSGDANAVFAPKGSMLEDYDMNIFARWGTKVRELHSEGWDGTMENGDKAPQGTYIYDVTYRNSNGLPQRKTGTFTLIPAWD